MKQDIENIIKKNLPDKKKDNHIGIGGLYTASEQLGFNQAISSIDTSLIADEVLKVVVEKIEEMKLVKSPEEHQRRRDHTTKSGYEQCLDDILHLLSNLSPKENKK